MTIDEFNKKLDAKLALILKEDKPLLLGVKSIMSIQSKRIWIDHKNKEGSDIGKYGNNDLYVNPKNSPKIFNPKGKSGETKFKNGKQHKTGYFKSYPDFKKSAGRVKRQSVDLFLFGKLAADWANTPISDQPPKTGNAIRINQHNYIVSLGSDNVDKVSRYGVNEVFGLSAIEKGKFLAIVRTELLKALI